jgi:hypothetical protein
MGLRSPFDAMIVRTSSNTRPSAMPRLGWTLSVCLILCSCASTPEPKFVFTGNILEDGPKAIADGPPRDRVLWQYRTAAAALRQGKVDVARQYLDDSIRTVQGIYGPDAEARKARGYFHGESKKTFIGEPYERAMAYFYRAVIYWMDGELDNARACFRSAQFEDSDTQDHQYAGDWVLPDYLDGLVTTRLGGDGSDAFKRATEHSKNISLPPYNPRDNVLLFVEFGPGPIKYSSGGYGEELHFRTVPAPVLSAKIKIAGTDFTVAPTDDVGFQATTRGGRVMDHVLGNKAVFKSATDTAGNVAIISGAVLATTHQGHHSAADEVGAGLVLAGILSKVVSASTTPQADTRTWDNLPQYISFATLSLPVGEHPITVEFLDPSGKALPSLTKTFTIHLTSTDRDKVVFISDKSQTAQTL